MGCPGAGEVGEAWTASGVSRAGRAGEAGAPWAGNSTSATPACRAPGSHPSFSLGPSCLWDWLQKGSHWSCQGQSGSHLLVLPCGLKVHRGLLSKQALGLGPPALPALHPPHWPSLHVHLWDHLYFSAPSPSLHFLWPLLSCTSAPCPALWAPTWSQDPATARTRLLGVTAQATHTWPRHSQTTD